MAPAGYIGLRNLDHDPELACALGNMVVAWASADQALIGVLATITNMPWKMAAATYHRIPTFESRTKVIRAMICEWETTEYDRKSLTKAVLKLNLLARKRNRWIHNYWAATPAAVFGKENVTPPMPTETVTFNFRAEADTPERRQRVTAHDVMNHNAAVARRYDELVTLTRRSSPGTFPPASGDPPDRH